jgi:hypothetical protein
MRFTSTVLSLSLSTRTQTIQQQQTFTSVRDQLRPHKSVLASRHTHTDNTATTTPTTNIHKCSQLTAAPCKCSGLTTRVCVCNLLYI